MLLRRLKLVRFIYLPIWRRKDLSNRSVDDVSTWSAMSRPIWDLNEMLLQSHVPYGIFNIIVAIKFPNSQWFLIISFFIFSLRMISSVFDYFIFISHFYSEKISYLLSLIMLPSISFFNLKRFLTYSVMLFIFLEYF